MVKLLFKFEMVLLAAPSVLTYSGCDYLSSVCLSAELSGPPQ